MVAHHGRVDADERYLRSPVVDDERSGELPQMDALSDLIHFAVSQLQNRTRCIYGRQIQNRGHVGKPYSLRVFTVRKGKPRDGHRIETGFLPESVAVI